jgi:tetratricopeptide (TPR) repeat protein
MKLLLLFFRYNEAEEQLNICLQIYKLCLPPNSFHYLVTKASLGLVYKQQGNYAQALTLFQNISRSLGKYFLSDKLKNRLGFL